METSNWSKWYIMSGCIRRYRTVGDKKEWARYPKVKYRHCKTPEELKKFVERLNHRYDTQLAKAKAAYDFKHRFISAELLEEFDALLKAEIPNRNVSVSTFNYLKRNCLHWFINVQGLPDPVDWKDHEKQWGLALLCKLEGKNANKLKIFDKPVHFDTISKHIQILNRFLRFLHQRLPKDVPAIVLEPVSKAQARLYRAEYEESGGRPGNFITADHWKRIEREIDPTIKPFVQLGYYYGLRQAECLAVTTDNLFEDSLDVERQLVAFTDGKPKYAPLKNRLKRQVPHWFISAEAAYKIITGVAKLMHSDTFGDRFRAEMERLDLPYGLHDLRRTFITLAFRTGKNPRDIMLAAGHRSLETTMGYAQDDRDLGRKRFVPAG